MNPLNKILLGIGAALALLVAVALIGLSLVNAHLRTQLAQAQGDDTACHMANDAFADAARRQNQAVARLKADGEARAQQAQAALLKARKDARGTERAIADLRKSEARGDGCQAADELLNHFIAGRL